MNPCIVMRLPSLERADRVHMKGGISRGIGNPPGPKATRTLSFDSVGQKQYGRPVVSGISLGALVGGSALSTREVSFLQMLAGEGSLGTLS